LETLGDFNLSFSKRIELKDERKLIKLRDCWGIS